MKPFFICVLMFAVSLNASPGQESALDFQEKSGALVFRDDAGKIIGLEFPGTGVEFPASVSGFGFDRPVVIDDSMKRWFDRSRPDSENDRIELSVSFAEAPERLTGVKTFQDLKWIIYKGDLFGTQQRVKPRNNEEGRMAVVIDAIEGLGDIQGVLIYDSTLPTGGLEKIVSLERLKAISLINCEIKTGGGYKELPDMTMIRILDH